MLTLLSASGSYFSSKRKQINKINYYAEKINRYYLTKPDKALEYANKLCSYYAQFNSDEDTACLAVEEWFIANPPASIKEKIAELIQKKNLGDKIRELSDKAKLFELYPHYTGKDSFRTLLQNTLGQVEGIAIDSIKSGNNPIVSVQSEHSKFIIRILTVSAEQDNEGKWPNRDELQDVKQITKPFLLKPVMANELEITYFEFGEHFENGNFKHYFKRLRRNKNNKLLSSTDFYNVLFVYAKKIIELYLELNQRNIWLTDLKPTNLLLDDYNEIAVSDMKGLILSFERIIRSNKTASTKGYYQSSVFTTSPDAPRADNALPQQKNWLNLSLIQQQTLATTLYELATGKLPQIGVIEEDDNPDSWNLIFDFSAPIFQREEGIFLKDMIIRLHDDEILDMHDLLREFSNNIKSADNPIILDEDVIEIASPRLGRNPLRPNI